MMIKFFIYIYRLTLKLECPMKLQKFPLDNQTCAINIGSCKFSFLQRFIEIKFN